MYVIPTVKKARAARVHGDERTYQDVVAPVVRYFTVWAHGLSDRDALAKAIRLSADETGILESEFQLGSMAAPQDGGNLCVADICIRAANNLAIRRFISRLDYLYATEAWDFDERNEGEPSVFSSYESVKPYMVKRTTYQS